MDYSTISLYMAMLLLLRYSLRYGVTSLATTVRTSFQNAGMGGKTIQSLGGIWFFLIGAPIAAWWILTFYIIPYIYPNGYTINLATVIGLGNPLVIFLFLLLWFGFALAFFGGNAIYQRGGPRAIIRRRRARKR